MWSPASRARLSGCKIFETTISYLYITFTTKNRNLETTKETSHCRRQTTYAKLKCQNTDLYLQLEESKLYFPSVGPLFGRSFRVGGMIRAKLSIPPSCHRLAA